MRSRVTLLVKRERMRDCLEFTLAEVRHRYDEGKMETCVCVDVEKLMKYPIRTDFVANVGGERASRFQDV